MGTNNTFVPLLPGNFYQIYNRGNNKENIFIEDRNYRYFLELWDRYICPIGDTYAYSLLKNHFHSLIRVKNIAEITDIKVLRRIEKMKVSGENFVSKSFSDLFNSYAKSINKSYDRTGSLFQERFRRKLIDNDSYFTEVVFYIHGKAQRHKFCKDFRKYVHSSYPLLISDEPSSLCKDGVLNWFGGLEAFKNYHNKCRESLLDAKRFLENENDD